MGVMLHFPSAAFWHGAQNRRGQPAGHIRSLSRGGAATLRRSPASETPGRKVNDKIRVRVGEGRHDFARRSARSAATATLI